MSVIAFIILGTILGYIFYMKSTSCSAQVNKNSGCHQPIINTYLNKIKSASNEFYDDYYTSYPYLGPHDTIGIDEITFVADYMRNIEVKEFNHIVSYHLPDNLKKPEKKPIPGKYE